LRAKSTNFQRLVFVTKTEKLLLWHLKIWEESPKTDVQVASEWKIKVYKVLKPSGEEFFFPSTAT